MNIKYIQEPCVQQDTNPQILRRIHLCQHVLVYEKHSTSQNQKLFAKEEEIWIHEAVNIIITRQWIISQLPFPCVSTSERFLGKNSSKLAYHITLTIYVTSNKGILKLKTITSTFFMISNNFKENLIYLTISDSIR